MLSTAPTPALKLDLLPRELIQYVRDLLPVYSAAALALTSKDMLCVVGSEALVQLWGKDRNAKALEEFLVLLERDVPQAYTCLQCLKLRDFDELMQHSKRSSRQSSKLVHDGECKYRNTSIHTGSVWKYIRFSALHLAMKEYSTLATTESLQKLCFANDRTDFGFRIVSGRLLMRGHHRIQFVRYISEVGVQLPFVMNTPVHICQHVSIEGHHRSMLDIVRHCIPHKIGKEVLCRQCVSVFSCPHCASEFQVTVEPRVSPRNSYDIVFTRWRDFGDCSSPNEPTYRSHISSYNSESLDGQAVPILTWEPGSIKAAFESSEHSKSSSTIYMGPRLHLTDRDNRTWSEVVLNVSKGSVKPT